MKISSEKISSANNVQYKNYGDNLMYILLRKPSFNLKTTKMYAILVDSDGATYPDIGIIKDIDGIEGIALPIELINNMECVDSECYESGTVIRCVDDGVRSIILPGGKHYNQLKALNDDEGVSIINNRVIKYKFSLNNELDKECRLKHIILSVPCKEELVPIYCYNIDLVLNKGMSINIETYVGV